MVVVQVRRHCTKPSGGLTLVELLITVAVLSVLAAILIPQLSGNLPERLTAAAQVVTADLDYARSLAVTNNSKYTLTFDTANNRYVLQHTGTNTLLNTLPRSPFKQVGDSATQQTTDLGQLPLPAPGVRLVAAVQTTSPVQAITTIEFNSLGGTTNPNPSVLWLAAAAGNVQRFISVQVDPVTGLATTGALQTSLPVNVAAVTTGGS
jgi:prepilin-type N-terminal cleavage/methylation domain-containing protein